MPRRFAFLCVLLLISSTSAFAQNVNDFLNMFRGLVQQSMIQTAQLEWSKLPPNEIACIDQTLRQQGASIVALVNRGVLPTDPGLSQLRSNCRVQVGQQSIPPPISASRPTFDCAAARTPVAQILCSSVDGALADWNLNASAWAYAASLGDDRRKTFWNEQDEWFRSLDKSCELTFEPSQTRRQCVIDAYQHRAKSMQSKMSPDALAEVKLLPEERAAIQVQLRSLGYLADQADAQFGPNTRKAIKNFQQANGYAASVYLAQDERRMLLSPSSQTATTATKQPAHGGGETAGVF
jgi:uncharacterized protein